MKLRKIVAGFTLVETILYIAILSIFITGAISFTFDVIYGREKAAQKLIVDQNLRYASARISYEIRRAKILSSVGVSAITLKETDNTLTTINLNSGSINISFNGGTPIALTSNQVKVTSFNITNLTSSDKNSENVKVDITAEQSASPGPGGQKASSSVSFSVEFSSQFNLARQLLIDFSGATLTGSNRLTNIKLRNTGDTDMLIDKMIVSWTNTPGGELIQQIQIAGGDVEWSDPVGQPSGTKLDILDFFLPAHSSQTPINNMQFSAAMDGAKIFVTFILSDGSSTTGVIQIKGGTAASTCLQVCQQNGYSSSICRRSSTQCTDNGEVNVTSGDQFCTVNPNDTCCCIP